MPETETGAAAGLIAQIAETFGLSSAAVEVAIAVFAIVALIVAVFAVLAIFRIRRELISLNFKIVYIGRLIEQAVKKSPVPKPAQKTASPPTQKPAPAAPAEATEKFKL